MVGKPRKNETKAQYLERRRVQEAARRARLANDPSFRQACSASNKKYAARADVSPKLKAYRKAYYERRYAETAGTAKEWTKRAIWNSKVRARKSGCAHTISADHVEIPEFCPVLGLRLVVAVGQPTDNSPSLDRLSPRRGYTPDNVAVISYRANRIKNDATLEEVLAVAAYMKHRR